MFQLLLHDGTMSGPSGFLDITGSAKLGSRKLRRALLVVLQPPKRLMLEAARQAEKQRGGLQKTQCLLMEPCFQGQRRHDVVPPTTRWLSLALGHDMYDTQTTHYC